MNDNVLYHSLSDAFRNNKNANSDSYSTPELLDNGGKLPVEAWTSAERTPVSNPSPGLLQFCETNTYIGVSNASPGPKCLPLWME
jgi:hypothetical protein